MRYKTVNDGYVKGLVLTAEAIMQLEEETREHFTSPGREQFEQLEGALVVIEFLKQSYRKIK